VARLGGRLGLRPGQRPCPFLRAQITNWVCATGCGPAGSTRSGRLGPGFACYLTREGAESSRRAGPGV